MQFNLIQNTAGSRSNLSAQMQGEPSWWTGGGTVVAVYWVTARCLAGAALIVCACSTSGTKKPVWVYPWCLQLCCFFTLLAKSCSNTHSRLTSSTWGKKYTIFFHCKSCPQYQGEVGRKTKAESWHGSEGDKRVAAAQGVAERETVVSLWESCPVWWLEMAYEFSWGQNSWGSGIMSCQGCWVF